MPLIVASEYLKKSFISSNFGCFFSDIGAKISLFFEKSYKMIRNRTIFLVLI